MGVEARFRTVEQRIAVENGLDVQERWVDIPSRPGLGVEVNREMLERHKAH